MNKLGFGFLHLPETEIGDIDYEELYSMVDAYLASGCNYFDTAYTYLGGKSEKAIGKAVTARYPRDRVRIAAKLPGYKVAKKEDCYGFFEEELRRCGTDYFDVYMLHWLNDKHYRIAEATGQFEFLQELKESGKALEIGFSFHDSAELLDEILTAHPQIDRVLIQLNYADWESPSIQSRLCYETILRHGKKVMVMEPAKGGTLAAPSPQIRELLQKADRQASPYELAFRFAESLPGTDLVLSGMSTLQQVQDNTKDRQPLTGQQQKILLQAAGLINSTTAVKCSGCGYCLKGCPKKILIPGYFKLFNDIMRTPKDGWKIKPVYQSLAEKNGRPGDCIGCRSCERSCPQKLPITEYLKQVHHTFEE